MKAKRAPANEAGPAVPVWSCSFEAVPGGEPKLDNLTAGSKFGLKCHGDIPVTWKPQPVQITFTKPEQQYTLVVLKTDKLEAQDAEFTVTGYKAGKQTPDYIRVMQGDQGFEVAKPTWEIKSVLKKGEQPKPYGPFGPYSMSLPSWIWFALALAVIALVGLTFRFLRRRVQKRRMQEELKRHRTALSPLHQFYRDSRDLRRRLHNAKGPGELKEIAKDLNRDFRLYVLREFQIPAIEWTDAEILTDLRKRYRKVWKLAADPVRKALRELLRQTNQVSVELKDVEQLHRMSLEAVERLQQAQERPAP